MASSDTPLRPARRHGTAGRRRFLLLAGYTLLLVWLICTKRRAAIVHNYLYCAVSIGCLVAWNALGMKSPIGTVIDSLPGVVGIVYFARSTRVRRTVRRPLR